MHILKYEWSAHRQSGLWFVIDQYNLIESCRVCESHYLPFDAGQTLTHRSDNYNTALENPISECFIDQSPCTPVIF